MNFTITITGEKHELADSLAVLKAIMGEQVGAGSVTAEVQPILNQPTYQQHQQLQQPVYAPPQEPAHTAPAAYAPPAATAPAAYAPPVQPLQYQTPVAPAQQQPTAVPIATQAYTLEQLAVAATPLMDAGKQNELTSLLNQFGVGALTQLPKERYGEFATALRGLGAKI